MKKRLLIPVIVVAAAAAGAAGWYLLGRSKAASDAAAVAAEVATVEAKQGTVSVRVEGPSIVEPYLTQTIRSRIEGVVVQAAAEGQAVAQGAVLVRFDPADQDKAVRQAEIALAQARVNREKAQAALARARTDLEAKQALFASRAVPQEQVTAAQDAVGSADSALKLADLAVSQSALALETAQKDREATVVRAPYAGVVLDSSLNPGDLVARGAALMQFADVSRVRLRAEVDEFDIPKVAEGQAVTVTSEALGEESARSKVERVSPAAEVVNNISIFRVSTVLDNASGKLRPGMSADLSILIRSDKGIVVPSRAVSTTRGRSYVKVLAGTEVETKRVTIGADDGTSVAVLEGLEAGEKVVVPLAGGMTLTTAPSAASATGTSVIPITVPGTGAR